MRSHVDLRSDEDAVHRLLMLWVSLLPPWLCWKHRTLTEWGQQQHWTVAAGELRQRAPWPALSSHVNSNILVYSGLWLERQYSLFGPAWGKIYPSCHVPHHFSLLLHPNQLHLREPYKPCLSNIIHYFSLWWPFWGTCLRKTAHVWGCPEIIVRKRQLRLNKLL